MTYPLTSTSQTLSTLNYFLGNKEPSGNTYVASNSDEDRYYLFSNADTAAYAALPYNYPGTFVNATCNVVSPTILSVALNDATSTKFMIAGMTGFIVSGNRTFNVLSVANNVAILQLDDSISGQTGTFTSNITITQFIANQLYKTGLSSIQTIDNSIISVSAYVKGYISSAQSLTMTYYLNRYAVNNSVKTTLYSSAFTFSGLLNYEFIAPMIVDAPPPGQYTYTVEFSSSSDSANRNLMLFQSSVQGLNLTNVKI